jgi:hypothetical protein
MPDVAIPSAGSSPATPAAAASAETTPKALEVPRDKAAYAEWRKTGKMPGAKPNEGQAAASADSSGSSAGDDVAAGGEVDLASEAGTSKQERGRAETSVVKPSRDNAATRLNELLGDLKRAGLTPAELKSFKREAQAATPAAAAPSAAPPAAATPAAQAPAPQTLEAPKKPKVEDFDSYEKYEEARDQYHADQTRFEIAKALEGERTRAADAEAERRNAAMLADATERYGADAGDVIKNAAAQLVSTAEMPGVIRAMLGDSPVLGDLLYVMGSKGELAAFIDLAKRSPGEAVRKLAIVEHLVKEELASKRAGKSAASGDGVPARANDGTFVKADGAAPPAKKVTNAPAPPSETGGRSAAPPDEVEAATKAQDFRAFRRAANERDLAARSGR